MAQGRATLTPQQGAALSSAFQALQRGETATALKATRAILATAPDAPDALHLLALCLRNKGELDAAVTAFERALTSAPNHPDILNNFGSLKLRMGQPVEAATLYRVALRAYPQRADIAVNLSLALTGAREYRAAADAARQALALKPDNPRALRALASALRELEDLEGAEAALAKAVTIEPDSGPTWTALGVVRRLIGNPAESLACYARARAMGYASAEIEDAEASAHLDLGDVHNALARAQALVAREPAYVAGHTLLAHILWEHRGDGENDPLAPFARAVAEQPKHRALRSAFVSLLLQAKRAEEALDHLTILRAEQDDLTLIAAQAMALEQAQDLDGATALFESAVSTYGMPLGLGAAYARHLLRIGRPDAAANAALADAERNPFDQQSWALLSIAWRLLDDPREHWLCDYDHFITQTEVSTPVGFADGESFFARLADVLNAMHTAQHAPINQSLRDGSQTSGILFGRPVPEIRALQSTLRDAISRCVAQLPNDPNHPFLRRKASEVAFSGSWSVKLRSSGRHINHFHPGGWLSSAFYVSLPPVVNRPDSDRSGWIKFGQPPDYLHLDLAPRRFVQPKVGTLVLFPSYVWHGTVPFVDDEPRLTVAFDAVPEKGG